MKTTKNVTRYYAMNLYDGRIAIVTRELLTNPDYRVVSERIAREIESGKLDWKDVAFQLRQRDSMNPSELLKRAEQEKVKNLRPSVVTRENVEQFETKISQNEVGEVFDGDGVAPFDPEPAAGNPSQDDGGAPADDGGEAPGETQAPPEAPPKAPAKAPAKKPGKPSKKAAPVENTPPADDGGDGVTL